MASSASTKQSFSAHHMFEIIPGEPTRDAGRGPYVYDLLYLSKSPRDKSSEITHVLNMCIQPHPGVQAEPYLHIPLDDIDDITPEIPKIIDLINHARTDKGKGLIHCTLDVNRSAAAVVSLLGVRQNITASQAAQQLKMRKPDGRHLPFPRIV